MPARKRVKLDELTWQPVDVGRLEDYEGFFGLDEIEDVDVVKDSKTGTVSFTSKARSNGTGPGTDDTSSKTSGHDSSVYSDFEGFGDDEDSIEPISQKSILRLTANHDADVKTQSKTDSKRDKVSRKDKAKKDLKSEAKGDKIAKASEGIRSAPPVVPPQIQERTGDSDDDSDLSAWAPLDLLPDTVAGLSKLKFNSPTPIQLACIPAIRDGSDVIGKASTGSGKTLAFGIPIFESWLGEQGTKKSAPTALIITPTRELAHQITKHLEDLASGLVRQGPVIATVTGGLSVQKQRRLLDRSDIIVGTPGRLWEVMSGSTGELDRFKQVKYLVLDEADRLLSQGNFAELEEILKALDRMETSDEPTVINGAEDTLPAQLQSRQTLVFSATLQKDLQQKLARKQKGHYKDVDKKEGLEYLLQRLQFTTKPKFIDVDPKRQMAANLKEGIVECGGQEKDLYLYAIQLLHSAARTLVFVNNISSVRRLVPFLQNLGLPALGLHSQMPQKARLRSIERFSAQQPTASKAGKSNVSSSSIILIATDVAARGLHIPDINLVLHYHLPRSSDAYVHRSGRTARAGASGDSIILCSPEEVAGVRRLIAQVHAASAASSNMSKSEAARKGYMIRSLDIDRRVVQRLKPRMELAKRIADVGIAKEKKSSGDQLFRQAAEDLGVEYDSEELEKAATGRQGRGTGRRKKEREDREVTTAEMKSMRGQLKGLLAQRINVGVSERYPTSGAIDFEAILRDEEMGRTSDFLGSATKLTMDD